MTDLEITFKDKHVEYISDVIKFESPGGPSDIQALLMELRDHAHRIYYLKYIDSVRIITPSGWNNG